MPTYDYDLVAIGAGTGGLTVTRLVAAKGKRVALIERDRPGGDCLYTGCVPTKALLEAAKLLYHARHGRGLGVVAEDARLDFPAVRQHLRRTQEIAGAVESPEGIARQGVELVQGEARFADPHTVAVGERRLTAANIVVATGSAPAIPAIPGLAEAGFETNAELVEWEELPASLGVVGGGPIGLEFAQMMNRFGVETTVFEALDQLLPRDEPDAAALIGDTLRREGITAYTSARVVRVEPSARGRRVVFEYEGAERTAECERLLVAVGRRPEVEGLGLEAAGVEYARNGIAVDKRMRTSQPHVYAVGDVAQGYQFTHVAEDQGRAVANTLNGSRSGGWSDRVVPRVTYTDPEVASVGLTVAEAREAHRGVRVWEVPLAEVDRAVLMGQTEGFIRIVTARGWQRFVPGLSGRVGDEIVGATIVAPHAGDLLMPIVVAMRLRLPAGAVALNMQPYPTLALGVRQAVGLPFSG